MDEEQNAIDYTLSVFEAVADADWSQTSNFQALRAVREELTTVGMDSNARDFFVANMRVNIQNILTPEQITRLLAVVRRIVRKFYISFKSEGFSDLAISKLAKSLEINL